MQVQITNGKGTAQIKSGTYTVATQTTGYDDTSVKPASVVIDKTTGEYNFTLAATGTLTLHVTEEGTQSGKAVVGATFIRCDNEGNEYGTAITSNSDGNAVFEHIPFDASGFTVYYKQTASDGSHEFDNTLKSISLTTSATTEEVANPLPITRTINLTDEYYSGMPIPSSVMTLE